MMITDSKVREAKSGKRKRITFDPYLRHEHKVITVSSMAISQLPQDHDDREPDMIHHFRISARLEEEKRSSYFPLMGFV